VVKPRGVFPKPNPSVMIHVIRTPAFQKSKGIKMAGIYSATVELFDRFRGRLLPGIYTFGES